MAGLAGKVSEVKLWGRGGSAARHRSPACKGRQFARRDFARTSRRLARVEARAIRVFGEAPEVFAPLYEDHDAHVEIFESRFCGCGPYCYICNEDDSGRDFDGYADDDDIAA